MTRISILRFCLILVFVHGCHHQSERPAYQRECAAPNETVNVEGTLLRREATAPTGLERYLAIELEYSICGTFYPIEGEGQYEAGSSIIHLVLTREQYRLLDAQNTGAQISLEGTLDSPITGHHHEDLLMDVSRIGGITSVPALGSYLIVGAAKRDLPPELEQRLAAEGLPRGQARHNPRGRRIRLSETSIQSEWITTSGCDIESEAIGHTPVTRYSLPAPFDANVDVSNLRSFGGGCGEEHAHFYVDPSNTDQILFDVLTDVVLLSYCGTSCDLSDSSALLRVPLIADTEMHNVELVISAERTHVVNLGQFVGCFVPEEPGINDTIVRCFHAGEGVDFQLTSDDEAFVVTSQQVSEEEGAGERTQVVRIPRSEN